MSYSRLDLLLLLFFDSTTPAIVAVEVEVMIVVGEKEVEAAKKSSISLIVRLHKARGAKSTRADVVAVA